MACQDRLILVVLLCLSLDFLILPLYAQEATCLADAVPEGKRQNLVNGNATYPIGIWVNGWPAGFVTASMVRILLEERLGFKAIEQGPGWNTVDGFYALAGCLTPTNIEDRGCEPKPTTTYNHICVEGWTESYAATWAEIERDLTETAPENLGNMGYFGKTSMFLPASAQEAAYNAEGLILEFYRGFNVSWTTPSRYFQPPSVIDTSLLKRCNETRMMISQAKGIARNKRRLGRWTEAIRICRQAMEFYANLTGDWDGVEIITGPTGREVRGKCFQEYFWYPPSCREDTSLCVPFFTGGNGWNYEETMQKATAWNMPLAPAVVKDWSTYTNLPMQVLSTFYWWVPDPTFINLKPMEIAFPPFDRQAFAAGDKRSSPSALTVDKYTSKDLGQLAPSAKDMIRALILDLPMVNDMLRDQLATGDSNWQVACRWLRANENVWKSWLPDPTQCYAQFGLYHEASGQYVTDRRFPSGLSCHACPSGTYSDKLVDERGLTFACLPCEAGTAQPSGASLKCEPCQSGEYQDQRGQKSCNRCGFGEYQDEQGRTGCKRCPPGTTTLGFGSKSIADCGCDVGTINAGDGGTMNCIPCMDGLHCPFGSTVSELKSGESVLGQDYTPVLKKGFFSTKDQPTEVFKCGTEERCPGGKPGECAGGREVTPCAECPASTTWVDDTCHECNTWTIVLWMLAVCGFLLALTAAYYLMNPHVNAKATAREAVGMSASVTVALVQSLAIFGLMTVKWPRSFQAVSWNSRIFLLDIEDFSFSCLASGPTPLRYVFTILVFPAGILWLFFCFLASQRCWRKWKRSMTKNTAGHFIQVGFSTMSALALQPLMCYTHPNGLQSLLKHPGVLCGSGEHSMMLLAGILLLTCGVISFLAMCSWAVCKLPRWSTSNFDAVKSVAFLFARFRMDRWWFGVPLLLRGPLLSLCVVAATDFPPAQTTGGIFIIAAFLLLQVMAWPWKLPLLNILDTWVSVILLMLISITPKAESSAAEDLEVFHEVISIVLLAGIVVGLGSMASILGCVLANQFLCQKGIVTYRILDLISVNPQEVAKRLTKTAQQLLECQKTEERLQQLNPMDLGRIDAAIALLVTDVIGSDWYGSRRVNLSGFHEESQMSSADVQNDKTPSTAEEDAVVMATVVSDGPVCSTASLPSSEVDNEDLMVATDSDAILKVAPVVAVNL